MVSQELLDKFKKIYKEEFEIELNDEETIKIATDLLSLMRILTQPTPKTEPEDNYQTLANNPRVEVKTHETD